MIIATDRTGRSNDIMIDDDEESHPHSPTSTSIIISSVDESRPLEETGVSRPHFLAMNMIKDDDDDDSDDQEEEEKAEEVSSTVLSSDGQDDR